MNRLPSGLDWLSDRMLRGDGLLFVQVEAHFDESGTHADAPLLCVGGYLIDKAELPNFEDEWNAVLNWDELPRPLPFFHMGECAHGNGPFSDLSKDQRIVIQTRMIEIIKRRTIKGFAVTLDKAEFKRLIPQEKTLAGTSYTFCCQMILAGISAWIDEHQEVEHAAYFFESGHDSQSEANRIMDTLFKNDRASKAHRYAGHGFVPKGGNPGVQAADLLVWQWAKDRKCEIEGRPRRMDCASLIEHPHKVIHVGNGLLAALSERLQKISQPLTREAFFFGDPEE